MHLQSICAHKFLPQPHGRPWLCGASCARLRHDQIKAKSKHNGGCLQPFAAANKNLWAKSQSGGRAAEGEGGAETGRGKVRKMRANKILANNRIIMPKGFAFWPSSAEALALCGQCPGDQTHTHTHTHTHATAIHLLRTAKAIFTFSSSDATLWLYWLMRELWLQERAAGGRVGLGHSRYFGINNDNSFTAPAANTHQNVAQCLT